MNEKNRSRGTSGEAPETDEIQPLETTQPLEDAELTEGVDLEAAQLELEMRPLPAGVETQDNGDWLYTLIKPIVISERVQVKKIRITAEITAKHIRHMGQGGKNEIARLFYLVSSMSGVQPAILDQVDGVDWVVLQGLAERVTLKNSLSVLRYLKTT